MEIQKLTAKAEAKVKRVEKEAQIARLWAEIANRSAQLAIQRAYGLDSEVMEDTEIASKAAEAAEAAGRAADRALAAAEEADLPEAAAWYEQADLAAAIAKTAADYAAKTVQTCKEAQEIVDQMFNHKTQDQ